MTDISTAAGLAGYRATAFTKPEPPAVEAMSVTIHMRVEPGHEIEGREIRTALWSRRTYVDDFEPSVGLHYDDGVVLPHDETPDALPEWVPRPPASWLALTAEMLAEVA